MSNELGYLTEEIPKQQSIRDIAQALLTMYSKMREETNEISQR